MIDRRSLFALGAMLPFAGPALAQQAAREETWDEKWQRGLREDWPGLRRYAEDNRKLLASGAKTNIVFLGDSITEGWRDKRPGFFTPGRVGRGISGQTTPQMVLRMMQDVIQLRPRYLHFMAGTNDIAGNTGPMTVPQTLDNIRLVADIARANGIKLLLACTPPADHFPWRPGLQVVKPIREINAWSAAHAKALAATWVDYTPVLADASGAMKPGMAFDGVHPTEQGYVAMESVIGPLLKARAI
ncbi:GDSL-type esterase/lipase family protein [Sphingomonas sp. LB-2]|uniref:GDSL-type esterase/lipase family protein n=1 Tax=Sphingomonas caeni TaxID=2984949 RepID=UPI00223057D3|nr:GDSL-type esterase/lipase family protein [Sphingomonas caeni]MCW3848228.1 GDSL-type esterase/lipase family protein [Sphingomonas caeni]